MLWTVTCGIIRNQKENSQTGGIITTDSKDMLRIFYQSRNNYIAFCPLNKTKILSSHQRLGVKVKAVQL